MPYFSVVLEGIDGSGKTTQALKMQRYFEKQKKPVFYLKSPRGSKSAELVFSRFLKKEMLSANVEMFSFLLRDSLFYEEIVETKMVDGNILIFDRWEGSFLNYFHNIRKLPPDFLESAWNYAIGNFKPDLVLLLDVSLEEAVARIKKKKVLSRFDIVSAETLEIQRSGFKELAERFNWSIINGNKSILEVQKDICLAIKERRLEWK